MALINRAGQEISAKVVYYGPGLSGKTTNLEVLFRQVPEESRGKMISMKTRTDRTLFFDLLPLSAESIHDFHVRILLYTVPGQVYYNATRRLVLKGVDAVVFVADSQRGKMQENLESLENLRSNLADMDLKLDELPWVIQYNKRDLPDILSVEELDQALNPGGVPSISAVAPRGDGVHETLQGISDHLRPELMKLVENEMRDQLRSTAPSNQGQDQNPSLVVPTPESELGDGSQPALDLTSPSETAADPPATRPEPATTLEPPQERRTGLNLDQIPDPPVIEMPPQGELPDPPSAKPAGDLGSLMPENPRQSLREVETTIHASPLRSLKDPKPERPPRDYETLLQSTEPECPALDTTQPGGGIVVTEESMKAPELMPPSQVIQPPLPTPADSPTLSSPESKTPEPEVLELVIPRRLIRDGQLTLRLRLEEEPAASSTSRPVAAQAPPISRPEPTEDGRVALRNGELVSLDSDAS